MDKTLVFHKPSFDEAAKLAEIYALRDNNTCDSTVLDTYIWKEEYNIQCTYRDRLNNIHNDCFCNILSCSICFV